MQVVCVERIAIFNYKNLKQTILTSVPKMTVKTARKYAASLKT